MRISVPDELAALIAKAAAFQVDQRDPGRHLEDLGVLLASSGGRRVLDLGRLTAGDRRHLRRAVTELSDPGHEAWAVLDQIDRAVGQRALAAVLDAVHGGGGAEAAGAAAQDAAAQGDPGEQTEADSASGSKPVTRPPRM